MTRWERRWYSVFELRRNRQASPLPHTFAFDNWRLATVYVFPCCEYSRTIHPVSPPYIETHNCSYTKSHHIQACTSTSTHSEDESSWGLRRITPQAPRLCHLRPGRHRANFGLGPIRNESEWWYRPPVNDPWATVYIFVINPDLFRGCFPPILSHS